MKRVMTVNSRVASPLMLCDTKFWLKFIGSTCKLVDYEKLFNKLNINGKP